ncbi:adenylosuccinate synthase [Flavicella sp.]|nr:adenylosuccinate synthase [Flavicella sp.]MDA9111580.1 adenylosuccinate synthase [Flavicella sp.]
MAVDLLLGLQWGDEGKGKIVDVLTKDYNLISRFQGGPNAGHTLIFDGHKHVLHTIPSGIFHDEALNIVGNGVVIDPVIFKKELENLDKFNLDLNAKILISRKAHLILPTHRLLDAASEASKGKEKIGSTLKGIGPTYMDKTGRNGMRVGDLELDNWKDVFLKLTTKHLKMLAFFDLKLDFDLEALKEEFYIAVKRLKEMSFIDSEEYLHNAIQNNKTILAEGAQGSLLDVDFGTYPFVTSSNTTAAGACTGLGIAPNSIGEVFGIFKAYTTRVGSGPFPTELFDEDGARMAKVGHEFGATTGRPRRCGWLDLVALKYACQVNGVTQLNMMKGDVLSGFETLKVCTAYNYKGDIIKHFPYNIEPENVSPIYTEFKGWSEDITGISSEAEFPKELSEYIAFVEKETGIRISIVSVGPDRKQTIVR